MVGGRLGARRQDSFIQMNMDAQMNIPICILAGASGASADRLYSDLQEDRRVAGQQSRRIFHQDDLYKYMCLFKLKYTTYLHLYIHICI